MTPTTEGRGQLERDLYVLRRAGYAIIPEFLDAEAIPALLEDACAFQDEVDQYRLSGGEVLFQSGWPLRNVRALYAVSTRLQDLAMDERLVAYARGYLNDPKLQDCQLLTNMPDERNVRRGAGAAVNFHRDAKWSDGPIRPLYMYCFVLLTEMTRANGGTIVVPGTHREREPEYYFKETDPGEFIESNFYPIYDRRYFPAIVTVEAPPGSLVLIDPMVIHAQGINVTSERRTVLNFHFMAGDTRGMLLDCRGLAERYGRVGLRADLLEMLVSDSQLPNEYGPLRGSG
jgi:ectoine hydroxylase-related dioxygenase (phytanoyl-CoA dioxygenase family)